MAQNPNLAALSAAGVSVWLDDLSRDRLRSGSLQQLIDTRGVVGVTTNPTIFQNALSHGQAYDADITELTAQGVDADSAIRTIITDDVRAACDVLRPQWEASDGVDGRVSIEVDPRLAHDSEETVAQAAELWRIVDRPNLFIKIPATSAGIPAITATLAQGVSVNVTLIFSVQRHRQVMDAYLAGLEAAKRAGRDLSQIHSVASFFVSRVDTEVDDRLEKIGCAAALALRGQAGIANAQLAYAAYQEVFENGTRYAALSYDGARVQRPLWASTGVKNPAYPDTMYITGLVARTRSTPFRNQPLRPSPSMVSSPATRSPARLRKRGQSSTALPRSALTSEKCSSTWRTKGWRNSRPPGRSCSMLIPPPRTLPPSPVLKRSTT